jgi:hypothetical protein
VESKLETNKNLRRIDQNKMKHTNQRQTIQPQSSSIQPSPPPQTTSTHHQSKDKKNKKNGNIRMKMKEE